VPAAANTVLSLLFQIRGRATDLSCGKGTISNDGCCLTDLQEQRGRHNSQQPPNGSIFRSPTDLLPPWSLGHRPPRLCSPSRGARACCACQGRPLGYSNRFREMFRWDLARSPRSLSAKRRCESRGSPPCDRAPLGASSGSGLRAVVSPTRERMLAVRSGVGLPTYHFLKQENYARCQPTRPKFRTSLLSRMR
jgi:hypothetical protein